MESVPFVGAGSTLEIVPCQLLVGKPTELWDASNACGCSTAITDNQPCAAIGAQVAPLLDS